MGTTSTEGVLELDLSEYSRAVIIARKSGYLDSSTVVEPPFPRDLQIVLKAEGIIGGSVQLPNGDPAGPGIRVVAVVSRGMNALVSRNSLSSVTDAASTFRIAGVEPDSAYALAAAGNGLFTARSLEGISGQTAGLTLVVHPTYGVLISLRETGGSELCVSKEFRSHACLKLHLLDSLATELDAPPQGLSLDGIAFRPADTGPGGRLLLFTTDSIEPFVGPIAITASLPGYAMIRKELYAYPIARSVAEETLYIPPQDSCFGTLVVSFRGMPPNWNTTAASSFLRLTEEGTAESSLLFDVPHIAQGKQAISCIPCGRYRVGFEVTAGLTSAEEVSQTRGPLEISPAAGASITVDLHMLGAFEFRVARDDSDYNGPLAVMLGRSSHPDFPFGMGGAVVEFARGPYFSPPLPPGEYSVALLRPFRGHPSGVTTVHVAEGRTTQTTIHIGGHAEQSEAGR